MMYFIVDGQDNCGFCRTCIGSSLCTGNPMDVAVAQTSDAMPDGSDSEEYKDGEHKEGKVCPVTGKTLQFQGKFS